MWFYSILIISVLSLVQGKSIAEIHFENVTLKWPVRYSFEATRICVLSGLVEDYKMWRAPNDTRIDTNNDADKSFVNRNSTGNFTQHKIHPGKGIKQHFRSNCDLIDLKEKEDFDFPIILPHAEGNFQKKGTEVLEHDLECTVFQRMYKIENTSLIIKQTVWAVKNNDNETWAPIKFVTKISNTRLGTLITYEIWEFNKFTAEIDDAVFELPLDCIKPNHTGDTEKLLFLNPEIDSHVEFAFNAFKKKHGRNYINAEHDMRRDIFKRNMRIISQTNKKNLGYKLAINHFADRTDTEVKKFLGFRPQPKGKVHRAPFAYSKMEVNNLAMSLPREYDARMYGLVSPVKNQEDCGSCWSFSTAAAVEGAYARSTGRFLTLSNQVLIDCAWPYGAHGCDGGHYDASFSFVMKYGLPTEAEYGSYKNANGVCNIKNMNTTYKISRYVEVPPFELDALKLALVNHGPAAVSVNANNPHIFFYSSGILSSDSCGSKHIDHTMAVVGYGNDHGETFWILKNSWGRQWGMDGYIHINAKNNACNVTTEPFYAVF